MNIKEVALSKLSDELLAGAPISVDNVDLINRILFKNSDDSFDGDIVLVLGNPTCLEDRIVKAVEIMRRGSAEYILLSGGVFMPQSTKTEALSMYDYCIHAGLPKEKIIVENESTTTRENIILSASLVSSLNHTNPRVVTVSSATHMRRVCMNLEKFKKLYPESSVFNFSASIHPSCDPSNWFLFEKAKSVVATELAPIHRYIYEYNYPAFEF